MHIAAMLFDVYCLPLPSWVGSIIGVGQMGEGLLVLEVAARGVLTGLSRERKRNCELAN